MIFSMTVPVDPVAKGRPRHDARGFSYTPERTRKAAKVVKLYATAALGAQPAFEGPIGIAVEFYCETRRKSDGDNLLKLVTDAMNGLVYLDDSQILEWFARIHRGVGRGTARTEVVVYPLED